jgi:hypothetical protein
MTDFWSNLSGGKVHTGSWGTPDFGITEALQKIYQPNNPLNSQGGSNLSNTVGYTNNPQPAGQPVLSNSIIPQQPTQQPTQQQTQQAPSGGGGSSTPPNPYTTYIDGKKLADAIKDGERDQWGNPVNRGPSQDDIQRAVDSIYGETMGYLNQNEGLIKDSRTAAEKQAEADLLANQSQLGTNREQTMGQLDTQQRKGQTQKEDALAQARRLFSDLQRGNIQRFGGATSAGQAASEIQGAEQQRQFGQTARQFNEFTQQIETARRDVENQFQTGMQQLQQGKQQAMAKIQSDFTNAIMQINNMRAQTEQQKGQAKLQALMQLRSEANQLQAQATQFEQQLALMREQANLNIQQYAKTTGGALNQGAGAASTFQNQAGQAPSFSQVGASNMQTQAQPTGMISNYYRPKSLYDQTGVTWG